MVITLLSSRASKTPELPSQLLPDDIYPTHLSCMRKIGVALNHPVLLLQNHLRSDASIASKRLRGSDLMFDASISSGLKV